MPVSECYGCVIAVMSLCFTVIIRKEFLLTIAILCMVDFKHNLHPGFTHWFNDRFKGYAMTTPDPDSEPCFTEGKVIARGSWDEGEQFADRSKQKFKFLQHQKLIRDFMTEESPFRGLLLYHKLGSGKTLTAIAVSEQLKKHRQVVVMTPASLRDNFLSELRKSGEEYARITNTSFQQMIGRDYFFVSYDASNFPQQLQGIPDGLNNKLLIVDEAHNMISMINNPTSTKGEKVYNTIMNASNCRLLMLSGTPIINDPFELGIYGNLLQGFLAQTRIDNVVKIKPVDHPSTTDNKALLFQDNVTFYHYFVDSSDTVKPELVNTNALKKRLVGSISYYAGLQPTDKILPEVEMHLVGVEMSSRQREQYEKVRKLERIDEQKMRKRSATSQKKKTAFGRRAVDLQNLFSTGKQETFVSAFRQQSRQFCNFVFPPNVPRFVPKLGDVNSAASKEIVGLSGHSLIDDGVNAEEDATKFSKDVEAIHADSLRTLDENGEQFFVKELHIHAPKWAVMVDKMQKSPGPIYVYSQYRSLAGVGPFALALRAHGYIEYGWGDKTLYAIKPCPQTPMDHTRDAITGKTWGEMTNQERSQFKPLTYMFWPRSSVKSDRKNHLLNRFNADSNKDGHVIKVFLSTKSGAEGLNLMNVRQVHIMEPYWNDMRIKQAVGRAVRQCSHATLPKTSRKVDAYIYYATLDTHPIGEDVDEHGKNQTTDQYVFSVANKKQFIIDRVERIMKEIALDCRINERHNKINDDFVCYEPVPNESDLRLDVSQEAPDRDVFRSKEYVKQKFRVINLGRPPRRFRIKQDDEYIMKDWHKGKLQVDRAIIPVYHEVNNIVVMQIELSKDSDTPVFSMVNSAPM